MWNDVETWYSYVNANILADSSSRERVDRFIKGLLKKRDPARVLRIPIDFFFSWRDLRFVDFFFLLEKERDVSFFEFIWIAQ